MCSVFLTVVLYGHCGHNEWPANHKGDKNPSPKIIALGKRITDVAGHMIGGVTAEDPEYWGLAEIITEEMAEVGLTMKRRVHYTFDQLCEMNKDKVAEKGKEGFQKLLDEMSYIGLLEYDYGYHLQHLHRSPYGKHGRNNVLHRSCLRI